MTQTTTRTTRTTRTMAPSDEELQEQVLDELAWDGHVRSSEIGVAIHDGIVTLSGGVDSYLARMAAQEAAHRVRGVKAVVNALTVRLPAFAERTDEDVARATLNALAWDAAIPADLLDVSVTDGWITLKGEVEWPFQRDAAERVVRRLAGVRGITDQISVKARPLSADLHRHIEQALVRSAALDAKHIRVEIKGSIAVLKGTVHSHLERRAAERTVLAAPGITAVENHIVLDPRFD